MAKVNSFHAEDSDVYHDNSSCTLGNNIEKENKKSGTGGKRKCSQCANLD